MPRKLKLMWAIGNPTGLQRCFELECTLNVDGLSKFTFSVCLHSNTSPSTIIAKGQANGGSPYKTVLTP